MEISLGTCLELLSVYNNRLYEYLVCDLICSMNGKAKAVCLSIPFRTLILIVWMSYNRSFGVSEKLDWWCLKMCPF